MPAKDRLLSPRDSAKLISSNSNDVSIAESGVSSTATLLFESLKNNKYSFKVWKEHNLHPKDMNRDTVDWIFLLDCLNFSFWVDDDLPAWTVLFEGEAYHGYWALCAGINRALKVITCSIIQFICQPVRISFLIIHSILSYSISCHKVSV